ncbi:MAG TPA: hypothetical protein VHO70_22505 [Chitinispirillaceae bacterium]|nr:hypothetical protein [Chitinispirillaceae bacterium]
MAPIFSDSLQAISIYLKSLPLSGNRAEWKKETPLLLTLKAAFLPPLFNNQTLMLKIKLYRITTLVMLPLFILCQREPIPAFHVIPAPFVYTIVEHNESIYYSTPSGEIFRFHPDNPDSIVLLARKKGCPIRGLAFKKDGTLYVSSYEYGIHRLSHDSLIAVPKMGRRAWAMKLDGFDNIWLAGRWGVFRQKNDTLIKFTDLREAYDVDFYQGYLAVAHRSGITLYDTSTGQTEKKFSITEIFWTIDIFDSLLTAGGVQTCALIHNQNEQYVPLGGDHNIPWSIVRDGNGNLILGTEKGLYRIRSGKMKAECISFKGKCIKSLLIDSKGRLWVGRYFKQ